jgi:endoglucanase
VAITDSKPGTDAAAGAAAAFAACSGLYAGKDFGESYSSPAPLKDEEYAATLLEHAKQLYNFAVNAKGGQKLYSTTADISEAYASSGYKDELTMAALFLAWADGDSDLFQEAKKYYDSFKLKGQNGVFNWDSKTPGLAVLFAQIANSGSDLTSDTSPWQTESERYFDYIVNEMYGSQTASMTDGEQQFAPVTV